MEEEEKDVAPMAVLRKGGTADDATGGREFNGPNEPLVVDDGGLAKSRSCKSISSRFLMLALALVARDGTGSKSQFLECNVPFCTAPWMACSIRVIISVFWSGV